MACETNPTNAGRAGQKAGIPSTGSKSAFVAGVAAKVSALPARLKSKVKPRTKASRKTRAGDKVKQQKKDSKTKKKGASKKDATPPLKPLSPGPGQVSKAKAGQGATQMPEPQASPTRPRQQIKIAGAFSGQELQSLSVQFRLDAAAARKQVQALKSGVAKGMGHDDPRPADWAQSDLKNYDFIVSQIGTESKRTLGRIDVSSLSDNDLVDLWDFSRHEADQAVRFIDHLQVGGSPIKGEAASYLTGNYNLKARFCAHLAAKLEPMITPEMLDNYERSS